MAEVIIVEPNISKEENEANLKRLEEVMQKITNHLLERIEKEGEENVIPPGCGIRLIRH
ncbi:MAG: hypothetical protein ACRCVJ_12265 [Clostridium sp.]|uniref:hypothetical protein n=1 Tax=Clostridium sp. TaxID=1506 RepID=UPI003F3F4D02